MDALGDCSMLSMFLVCVPLLCPLVIVIRGLTQAKPQTQKWPEFKLGQVFVFFLLLYLFWDKVMVNTMKCYDDIHQTRQSNNLGI